MRVSIVGAGNVGRFIAREMVEAGHSVLLIDRDPKAVDKSALPEAEWFLADACELDSLAEAHLEICDVAIAATGDDKSNLVHSLLAKTEFGIPRTVARVNRPANEWLFDEVWGVDVAVSTPAIMCALAEEAVSVGDLVRLFRFTSSETNLVEMTLPATSPRIGQTIAEISWPAGVVLVALIRDGRGLTPDHGVSLEAADKLLFVASAAAEKHLADLLRPGGGPQRSTAPHGL